ncbi:unnamed protein product [Vitrella brassicaformis CCMP3155]|uniref:Uncharacterized protein n=2 Tax=Vitrella brassicaformis TaxID=1169539 RepID=A0A0G4GK09_VITBC|nr:unnamed protein product [Vitrella brassicaformis CCMP3155]|eukprot:CEM30264.1 unnamed protein product [Vitrella brassicaformis CCMP3155]
MSQLPSVLVFEKLAIDTHIDLSPGHKRRYSQEKQQQQQQQQQQGRHTDALRLSPPGPEERRRPRRKRDVRVSPARSILSSCSSTDSLAEWKRPVGGSPMSDAQVCGTRFVTYETPLVQGCSQRVIDESTRATSDDVIGPCEAPPLNGVMSEGFVKVVSVRRGGGSIMEPIDSHSAPPPAHKHERQQRPAVAEIPAAASISNGPLSAQPIEKYQARRQHQIEEHKFQDDKKPKAAIQEREPPMLPTFRPRARRTGASHEDEKPQKETPPALRPQEAARPEEPRVVVTRLVERGRRIEEQRRQDEAIPVLLSSMPRRRCSSLNAIEADETATATDASRWISQGPVPPPQSEDRASSLHPPPSLPCSFSPSFAPSPQSSTDQLSPPTAAEDIATPVGAPPSPSAPSLAHEEATWPSNPQTRTRPSVPSLPISPPPLPHFNPMCQPTVPRRPPNGMQCSSVSHGVAVHVLRPLRTSLARERLVSPQASTPPKRANAGADRTSDSAPPDRSTRDEQCQTHERNSSPRADDLVPTRRIKDEGFPPAVPLAAVHQPPPLPRTPEGSRAKKAVPCKKYTAAKVKSRAHTPVRGPETPTNPLQERIMEIVNARCPYTSSVSFLGSNRYLFSGHEVTILEERCLPTEWIRGGSINGGFPCPSGLVVYHHASGQYLDLYAFVSACCPPLAAQPRHRHPSCKRASTPAPAPSPSPSPSPSPPVYLLPTYWQRDLANTPASAKP